MASKRMTDRKRNAPVPDKPTGIAPGDADYPGKGARGKGSKGDAASTPADVGAQGGRDQGGKTGPKGANMGAATQS